MTYPTQMLEPRPQADLPGPPHDRWVTATGFVQAEFHRTATGYLVRFPGQADFAIDLPDMAVRCYPASDAMRETVETLLHNAIEPLIGNHLGGLFLHGSAVRLGTGQAIAFVAESRRGKTTLAGAFAQSGHPFLSEDTIDLVPGDGGYAVRPSRPVLRLFGDSAAHLLGQPVAGQGSKQPHAASTELPFCAQDAPLGGVFLLGPGAAATVTLDRLGETAALSQLMRHAFILDVIDKPRLRAHFQRLSDLAAAVPCYALDFPRDYAHLPAVISAILQLQDHARSPHAA